MNIFEDNNGTLEIVKKLKMRPPAKNVAIKHHHFRTCVEKGDIVIEKVDTAEQKADFLAKLLALHLFCYLSKKAMGWQLCVIIIIITCVCVEEIL